MCRCRSRMVGGSMSDLKSSEYNIARKKSLRIVSFDMGPECYNSLGFWERNSWLFFGNFFFPFEFTETEFCLYSCLYIPSSYKQLSLPLERIDSSPKYGISSSNSALWCAYRHTRRGKNVSLFLKAKCILHTAQNSELCFFLCNDSWEMDTLVFQIWVIKCCSIYSEMCPLAAMSYSRCLSDRHRYLIQLLIPWWKLGFFFSFINPSF